MKKLVIICLIISSSSASSEDSIDSIGILKLHCSVTYERLMKIENKIIKDYSYKKDTSGYVELITAPNKKPYTIGKLDVTGETLSGGSFHEIGCEVDDDKISCKVNNQNTKAEMFLNRNTGSIDFSSKFYGLFSVTDYKVTGLCRKAIKKF